MSKNPITYVTSAANGSKYAEKIAESYRQQGYDVKVQPGQIPQWGSGNPYSSNHGETEAGYRIVVTKKTKP